MGRDNYTDLKAQILDAAHEDTDGTSDWDTYAGDCIIEAFRALVVLVTWLCLRKYPPGAIALLAPITNLTVTATAGGTSATLSAVSATDLDNYIIIPSGADYIIRITAHTAGSDALTVDAVPETLAAAACTIVKIEYDLASDAGILVDNCFWTGDGRRIPIITEGQMREEHPYVPQAAWPAKAAARVAKTKVRFSSYPSTRERVEYPYNYEPSDPSGATTFVLDEHLVAPLFHHALSLLYGAKREFDLMKAEQARYQQGIDAAEVYEERLLVGVAGGHANDVRPNRGYGN